MQTGSLHGSLKRKPRVLVKFPAFFEKVAQPYISRFVLLTPTPPSQNNGMGMGVSIKDSISKLARGL